MLQQAEQTDAEEDAALGSRRGDELPEELKRRQERLQAIEAAMSRLEHEAKVKAEEQRRERAEAEAQRQASGKSAGGRPPKPISEEPEDKAQTNFTDPESKIMKVSNKGFDYCFNAQVVVDEEHQIILAAEVVPRPTTSNRRVPMGAGHIGEPGSGRIERRRQPMRPTGHGGPDRSRSAATMATSAKSQVEGLEAQGFDPHMATGRPKHNQPRISEAVGPPPAEATVKERMAHKLRTKEGRACYAKRKQIVEPVFGQIKQGRGFRQFLLRGLQEGTGGMEVGVPDA